jgi:hypothetical protein
MGNLKQSIKEINSEIKRTDKTLSISHVELLKTTQKLHHRLTMQKEELDCSGQTFGGNECPMQ